MRTRHALLGEATNITRLRAHWRGYLKVRSTSVIDV